MKWYKSLVFICVLLPLKVMSSNELDNKLTHTELTNIVISLKQFSHVLELVRLELGGSKNRKNNFVVTHIKPREIYFQTLEMFRKADRLSFEWTQTKKREPDLVDSELITSQLITANIALAYERLLTLMNVLKLNIQNNDLHDLHDLHENDIFVEILLIKQQLNILLSQPIQPQDVLPVIDQSLAYTKKILDSFNYQPKIEKPSFIRRKSPSNVYKLTLENYTLVKNITAKSPNESIDIMATDEFINSVTPSDVYDLSALVLSEIIHLYHIKIQDEHKHDNEFHALRYQRHILPSHVYQQADLLNRHLSILLSLKQKRNGGENNDKN